MPYSFSELTWVPNRKKVKVEIAVGETAEADKPKKTETLSSGRWRKRYRKKDYYLKSKCKHRRDRAGYLAAVREWERLKAYLDGLGPNPYTESGAIIPENQVINPAPKYIPPAADASPAPPAIVQPIGASNGNGTNGTNGTRKPETPVAANVEVNRSLPTNGKCSNDPPWIQSVGIDAGLRPELVIDTSNGNPYSDERRISALADFWLDQRQKQVERGELSKAQWDEDRLKLNTFRDFLRVNFPSLVFIDDIDPAILNLYRDNQFSLLNSKTHKISKVTLRKRLAVVAKWLTWLLDQNILAELPKDLRTYGRVKIDPPKPKFWTVEEIKTLVSHANERNRLYLMLALNLGWTQQDIATLENSMIDWDTGIVTRERHKTGIPTNAKLWPSTLELLRKQRARAGNLVLLNQNGNPLIHESVNEKGNLIKTDTVRLAFSRLKKSAGMKNENRSFKHLRKSAANEIERTRPDLTSLFLGHSERGMKRHYVSQHFDELFSEVDKLESLYFPAN